MKKLLLLLLLSLMANAQGRIKAEVLTNSGGMMFNEFDTQVEAEAYTLKIVKQGNWGQTEWTETDCGNSFETRVNPTTTNTEYLCGLDFTVTYSDITVEYQQREALRAIKIDMVFGKDLYAKIRLMIKGKALSKGARKTLRTSLSSIREDLFDGDICSAREDIAALTATATITEDDKTKVLGLIDSHKTCI